MKDSTELYYLRQHLELRHRRAEVVERRLRKVLKEAGLASETVYIDDRIPPCEGRDPVDASTTGDGSVAAGERGAFEATGLFPNEFSQTRAETDPSWWPRLGVDDAPSIQPTPGWGCYSIRKDVRKVLGVVVCGMTRAEMELTVETVANAQSRSLDFIPVFLTDSMDFDIFLWHGFVFEYLPREGKRTAGTKTWEDYVSERLELLKQQYGITQVIKFGKTAFGE